MQLSSRHSGLVTQAKAPKLSSKTHQALKQALQLPFRSTAVWSLLTVNDQSTQRELLEHALYSERKAMLIELANLHDNGFGRFRRMWGRRFFRVRQNDLFLLRDQLRRVWSPGTTLSERQRILGTWSQWQPQGFDKVGFQAWFPSIPLRRLLPHYGNLHAQVVQGVLEHLEHLTYCGNPDCLAPYFIARRSDQKYCERGDCTRYAQRQFSLDWWKREGSKRRTAKQKQRGVSSPLSAKGGPRKRVRRSRR
jgi:hypothetical protein